MSTGKVVEIIGAVVDVQFKRSEMPKVYDALKIESAGLTLEVQQQLGDGVARSIAMGSTDGLRRGAEVVNHQIRSFHKVEDPLPALGAFGIDLD